MQEIPFRLLINTITGKRLLNAGLTVSSYVLSALTKRNFVWGRPLILTIEPTNLCNLRCPLCVTGNGKMTRKTGLMTFKAYKNILDEIGDYLFYLLLYQQGEPFINQDFIRFIEYAKSKRIFVTTSTNGHYLSPEMARRTVASGIDSMIVSIDGSDQQSYETYRVGGKLSTVLAGIDNLVREKARQGSKTPVIFVQFIVMQHNQHQIPAMERLAKRIGADRFLAKTVQVETMEEARTWLPEKDQLRRYHTEKGVLAPKRTGRGPCLRPWTSSLVNWDGSVVPCCFDKNGSHPLGTLSSTSDFERIWESEKYDTFRAKMLTNRDALNICSNCSQGLRLFV